MSYSKIPITTRNVVGTRRKRYQRLLAGAR
jgi:hypothetical protein